MNFSFFNTIHKKVSEHARRSDYAYDAFALFNIIANPIFYAMWAYVDFQGYENVPIRIGIIGLSLLLLSRKYWPEPLKSTLTPWCWYTLATFALPIFFTFMLLKHNFSFGWSLNSLCGVVLSILLLDYRALTIIMPLGILIGYILFSISGPNPPLATEHYKTILITYMAVFVFGFLFSRRRDILEAQRHQTLKSAAGAIAHEMRTPLANVSMSGYLLKNKLQKIRTSLAQPSLEKETLGKELTSLEQTAEELDHLSQRSQNLINLLLTNLKQNLETLPQRTLSIKTVLETALKEFAYHPHEDEKVHLTVEEDFSFQGNQEIMTHVFFNLLKNSLYFIQAVNKGEIFITVSTEAGKGIVTFKDTGPGIEQHRLAKLFTPFYSQRPHGTGIGLSFCKRAVESMRGTIKVASQLGEYTTFTIKFPCQSMKMRNS